MIAGSQTHLTTWHLSPRTAVYVIGGRACDTVYPAPTPSDTHARGISSPPRPSPALHPASGLHRASLIASMCRGHMHAHARARDSATTAERLLRRLRRCTRRLGSAQRARSSPLPSVHMPNPAPLRRISSHARTHCPKRAPPPARVHN
ncbi:hypothetical protein OBBRIDRAFT_34427 [Obba rivulosa]|uniref:Uncharacterized protein n=1 Tax=Obba rivulosa TaxID=1052685 RepID=A0A8E2AW66_9APHY|nr:hypothetical protein OBBRIDRAFT_34427 [Obba rivulosa]